MDRSKWRVRKLRRDMPCPPGVTDEDYREFVQGRPWGVWPPRWDIRELPMFVAREHAIALREALVRADFTGANPDPAEQVKGWFTSAEGAIKNG